MEIGLDEAWPPVMPWVMTDISSFVFLITDLHRH